jgi:hypothetical protein
MKKLSQLLVLLALLSIGACKKEKCTVPEPTPSELAVGTWVGKFGIGIQTPVYDFTMTLYKNGELKIVSGNSVAQIGTWNVVGTEFNAAYTFEQISEEQNYFIRATITNNKTLTGNYYHLLAGSTSGNIILTKQ